MKIKITCHWFKESGKYYTTGEGEIEKAAWDHFFSSALPKADRLAAFHIALQKAGDGALPGLSVGSTAFALTILGPYPHHFQAGVFDR